MTEAASSITFDIVRDPRRQAAPLPHWISTETEDITKFGSPAETGVKPASETEAKLTLEAGFKTRLGTGVEAEPEAQVGSALEVGAESTSEHSSTRAPKDWGVCVGRQAPHLEIRIITRVESHAEPSTNSDPPETSGTSSSHAESLPAHLTSKAARSSCSHSSLQRDCSQSKCDFTALLDQGSVGLPLNEHQHPVPDRNGANSRRGGQSQGDSAPPFTEGVVEVRGPNVFLGYWNQPEETAKVLSKHGWFTTGDVGYLDNRGRLWLCGREKDMVKTGGENVHAVEVSETFFVNLLFASDENPPLMTSGVGFETSDVDRTWYCSPL
jgi:acyl-CoA synthetase (AMP-forming)/AMP-acid ligase II